MQITIPNIYVPRANIAIMVSYKKSGISCLSLYNTACCHPFHRVVDAVDFRLTHKHLGKRALGPTSQSLFLPLSRCGIFSMAII